MRAAFAFLLFAGSLTAQNTGLTARQLYYQDASPQPDKGSGSTAGTKSGAPTGGVSNQPGTAGQTSTPAATTKSATPARPKGKAAKATQASSATTTTQAATLPASSSGTAATPQNNASSAPRAHLGLRYNLLLVNVATGRSQEVDPDTNFKTGDCLAIQLKPNRSGRVYIFNQGSSGTWQILLPSPDLASEPNTALSDTPVKFPRNSCFKLEDPKGIESLTAVITEREEDFLKLNNAMRDASRLAGTQTPAPPPSQTKQPDKAPAVQQYMAQVRQDQGGQLMSRDISIQKIGASQSQDEPPNSVYYVNTSTGGSERLVIEIKIRHQ